ncbi:MAG TPA: hypothetical protein VH396_14525 [Chitinophagaceae bacterium]
MRTGFVFFLIIAINTSAQTNAIYANLPVGKYPVGFKIFTLTDPSRIAKPEYNYLGEKIEGDRRKKITVHLWYPAKINNGKQKLTYGDYCYNSLLSSTSEIISKEKKEAEINGKRRSVEGWFGKTTDEAWKKLIATNMLAQSEAVPVEEKFPLLIGMLRPLSTTITNELLASNGYVVAMIKGENSSSFAGSALHDIPDMRFVIVALEKNGNIDDKKIGTFGFSGSGFSQVVFAMNDYRIKAVADIESGIYMDVLFQNLAASDYYQPSKLRAPFLHIFSLDLSRQEKFINEFYEKTKFTKRYRLVLNQHALHHWDFASEGYTSCTTLEMRGAQQNNIQQSFEIAALYLLNFFDAELKNDANARTFLSAKPAIEKIQDSLWNITVLNAAKAAPDKDEFEYIIKTKGIDEAVSIVKSTIKEDTTGNLMQWFILNGLGYTFLNEGKLKEAIGIFKLNTELHPGDPNLFDSLAEGYELSGDKENMKKISVIVMDLLNKKDNLTDADKGLKGNAEKRLKL